MQPRAGADAQDLARENSDIGRSAPRASISSRCVRRLCLERCCMTSAAEHRRPVPSDGEAILNALPNPVLLVAPDGKIVDANMAAESFFEISTQFLQRQSLKELVPFGSPLLALIDQVRSSGGPVNIHSVLDHVKRLAQSGFARNIRFVEDYDPSLPPVLANQDQLIQVFLNLVKNAAEAVVDLGSDAEIQLTTAFRPGVRLSVPGKKSRVSLPLEFCVMDNGSGVPEDLLPNLFDPSLTTQQTGSGLGLALVAKSVR